MTVNESNLPVRVYPFFSQKLHTIPFAHQYQFSADYCRIKTQGLTRA